MKNIACEWMTKSMITSTWGKVANDLHQKCLRGSEFIHWSQAAEYPWVFEQLALNDKEVEVPIFDVGSGISVLPHMLARFGRKVIATDYFDNIRRAVGVETRIVDGFKEPEAQYPIVTCISVLEHVFRGRGNADQICKFYDNLVKRTAPGGLLIVTMDRYQGPDHHKWEMPVHFFDEVTKHMGLKVPPEPADILCTKDHPEASKIVKGNITVLGATFRKDS